MSIDFKKHIEEVRRVLSMLDDDLADNKQFVDVDKGLMNSVRTARNNIMALEDALSSNSVDKVRPKVAFVLKSCSRLIGRIKTFNPGKDDAIGDVAATLYETIQTVSPILEELKKKK